MMISSAGCAEPHLLPRAEPERVRLDAQATRLGLWAAWAAGIGLLWAAFGVVAAVLWWFLFWPVLCGAAMAYSSFEDRGVRRDTPSLRPRVARHSPQLAPWEPSDNDLT
jgi:hypothetical protein